MTAPEQLARQDSDALFEVAGRRVCSYNEADIHASRGVAIREFQLADGGGAADYLLYGDGKAIGLIEAKTRGARPLGVQAQSARYMHGMPPNLPAGHRPPPASSESIMTEGRFTNRMNLHALARALFPLQQLGIITTSFEEASPVGPIKRRITVG